MKKIEQKNITFIENLIDEYNRVDGINCLRVNFTEYITTYHEKIKDLFESENVIVPRFNNDGFVFKNKKYSTFINESKKIISYQILSKREIEKRLSSGYYIFLITYKFGGGEDNGEPKYMVWVEKDIKFKK